MFFKKLLVQRTGWAGPGYVPGIITDSQINLEILESSSIGLQGETHISQFKIG